MILQVLSSVDNLSNLVGVRCTFQRCIGPDRSFHRVDPGTPAGRIRGCKSALASRTATAGLCWYPDKGKPVWSKGESVEPWGEGVARPMRANGNGRGLPLHRTLRHDPSQMIFGTPGATAVSLLWRCHGPKALSGSFCHLSSGALAGSSRDCRAAPAIRTAIAGSLLPPPGGSMDRNSLLS